MTADNASLRANGICNTPGRGATVISPFVVGYLMVNYGLPGVQILAVHYWGVEPARRPLEGSEDGVNVRHAPGLMLSRAK
jgi:hypothetical protein